MVFSRQHLCLYAWTFAVAFVLILGWRHHKHACSPHGGGGGTGGGGAGEARQSLVAIPDGELLVRGPAFAAGVLYAYIYMREPTDLPLPPRAGTPAPL